MKLGSAYVFVGVVEAMTISLNPHYPMLLCVALDKIV